MPKPVADLDTEPFWAGADRRELLLPRCASCGATRWPPGPCCPACQSFDTEWFRSEGKGTVYSWTVVTHPVAQVLQDQVPYVVALVDLTEGTRILGNLIDVALPQITAGMAVSVVFEQRADGVMLPNFAPA